MFASAVICVAAVLVTGTASAEPFCQGCGCNGGPGWRHVASWVCVSWVDMDTRCKTPHTLACVCEHKRCQLPPAKPKAVERDYVPLK